MRHLLKRPHLLEEVSRSGYDLESILDMHTPQSLFVHPDYGHVASPDAQDVRRVRLPRLPHPGARVPCHLLVEILRIRKLFLSSVCR